MSHSSESLRGYGYQIHKRDHFICQYCGADGSQSYDVWITLTVDHLLPAGHPNRDNPEYMVTACSFCNTADNLYFKKYTNLKFDNMTRDQLVAQRLPYVMEVREKFRLFWEENVKSAP